MKKIHIYIISLLVAFASVGCTDEVVQTKESYGEIGDEVQFGLSLTGLSRTIYGTEENNAFPIYWVNGDKVTVYSPQCLEGKKSAEYKVTVPEGRKQNYATSLDKIGANGVQWGNEDANFYSLYPSGQYTLSKDGKLAQNVKIGYSQDVLLVGNGPELKNMTDCLMFAKAENVPVGETVNLNYKPLATAIMITLSVDAASAEDFVIQAVNVTAPTVNDQPVNIVGEFNVDIATGGFVDWVQDAAGKVKASNTVKLQLSDHATGAFPTIYNNASKGATSLTIPVFIAPRTGLTIEGWKFEIVTNKGAFTKTIKDKDAIKAGMVHKLTLPKLSVTATTDEWDVSNWMVHIPRNVYLSEISIPGTWNSLNSDFQRDQSISNQYALGVRAFHIDTRWKRTGISWIVGNNYKYSLGTADGGGTSSLTDGKFMTDADNPTFESSLKLITDKVQSDEYMVLFCTFAQKSNNHVENGNYWYDEISRICAENEKVYDASTLTKNTLVGDVLGHVIVVVNLASSVSSVELPENSRCLFTYVPMELPSDHYATTTSHIDALYYSSKLTSGISMYTSHAQISTTNTSAQNCGDRGYSHPLTSRDNLVTSFWDWSESNYGTTNYNHDKWIYLGLGGYILNSTNGDEAGYETIENRYASMVYNRIDKMGKNNVPFYPVGIILMNNKKGSNYTDDKDTDLKYGFSDVCKQILMLNNKYRLQFDPNKPSDYNPNAKQAREYNAVMLNGGAVFQ